MRETVPFLLRTVSINPGHTRVELYVCAPWPVSDFTCQDERWGNEVKRLNRS